MKVREAFQTKKRGNLGKGPNRGCRKKIKKVPSFSWEKFKIRREGGSSEIKKIPEGTKD